MIQDKNLSATSGHLSSKGENNMKDKMQEIEIKIKLDVSDSLIKKVEDMGGVKTYESLEHDVYYDNDSGFYESGQVFRLRTEAAGNLLTYKGPLKDDPNLLQREEIQTYVTDEKAIKLIIERLGFRPKYVKEKKVTYYKLLGFQLEFHTVPFLGDFLEIENEEDKLREFLPTLGLSLRQGIPKGYHSLFEEYKREKGLPNLELTFDEEKRHHLQ
jgi:predicted adenylyl cyclase CyaB